MPEITMHGKVKMKEGKFVWKEFMINETISNVYLLKNDGIDQNINPLNWFAIMINTIVFE